MKITCYLFGHRWKLTGRRRNAVLEIHDIVFETDEHVCTKCGVLDGRIGRFDKSGVLRDWWRGLRWHDYWFMAAMLLIAGWACSAGGASIFAFFTTLAALAGYVF